MYYSDVTRIHLVVILSCLLCLGAAGVAGYILLHSQTITSPLQPGASYIDVATFVPDDSRYTGYRTENVADMAYKPLIVRKEVIVEKLVEKPVELREFGSRQELVEWLERDETDATLYFTAEVDWNHLDSKYDCDDFAYRLQWNALFDGYLMSTEIIFKDAGQHMVNSTAIGNHIYFIEPQTDEVWLGAHRD